MLRFILGRSGSGKTAAIHNRIRELVQSGEEQVLLLVPDQSSFETEKAFLEGLGARLCKRVEVFGFDGMCRYVFAQTRCVPTNVIDNGTRAVLMSIALDQLSEKLTLLPSRRNGAVADMLLGTLAECRKNGISNDRLRDAAAHINDETLQTKLRETALVLDTFDALLAQSYVDPLDHLERLKNILLENQNLFKNRVLFIDSFSGFTKVQLEVLRILLSRCREVNIALTLDPQARQYDEVFQISHATRDALTEMAKQDFAEIKAPVKLTAPMRFASDDLAALEENVFRRHAEPREEAPKDIVLYRAADLYDECEFVARRIKRLVMEESLRYRDISVICRDSQPYRGILNVMLEKYDIPYFMDSRQDVTVKPAVRLVNAVFRLVTDGFAREDFLSGTSAANGCANRSRSIREAMRKNFPTRTNRRLQTSKRCAVKSPHRCLPSAKTPNKKQGARSAFCSGSCSKRSGCPTLCPKCTTRSKRPKREWAPSSSACGAC